MSKNNIEAIVVIMGTIIGAGFASGREIYTFFAQFGNCGIIGILISAIMTGIVIYCTMSIVIKNDITNNLDFTNIIHESKNLYNMVNIFLLIIFYIMIAGFSGYFKQEYNIPQYITSSIFCICLYFVLIRKINGIVKANTFLVPILIIFMLFIIVKYNIPLFKITNKLSYDNKCIFYSILYASYNSIILIPILIILKNYIKSKRDIRIVSASIAFLILILTFGLYNILLNSNINIENIDIPIVSIINKKSEKIMYLIVIQSAIFTSAISAGYGVLENINKKIKDDKVKYRILIVLMCIAGVPISYIGFGKLISLLYPIFGILGLLQIILIFKYILKKC